MTQFHKSEGSFLIFCSFLSTRLNPPPQIPVPSNAHVCEIVSSTPPSYPLNMLQFDNNPQSMSLDLIVKYLVLCAFLVPS